jgi:hypothetical protein
MQKRDERQAAQVAARSKALTSSSSIAGIVGSNPRHGIYFVLRG